MFWWQLFAFQSYGGYHCSIPNGPLSVGTSSFQSVGSMVKPPAANHHQHGHGKIHPFLIGVPSISIRAIYTMAMVNNQRVIEFVAWVHCPTLSHLAFSAHRRQWTMAEDHPIPTDALAGLADRWESFAPIRQRFREEGGLLLWPTKDTVGLPSMKLEHF